MGKALAVLATVASATTAVLVLLASRQGNALHLAAPALAILGSFFTFRHGRLGIAAGITMIVWSLVAFVSFENITGKAGNWSYFHDTFGFPFVVATGLLVPVAYTALHWRGLPQWQGIGGAAAGAVALVYTTLIPEDKFGSAYASNMGWLIPGVLLALAAGVPAFLGLRGPPPTRRPAPLSSSTQTVGGGTSPARPGASGAPAPTRAPATPVSGRPPPRPPGKP